MLLEKRVQDGVVFFAEGHGADGSRVGRLEEKKVWPMTYMPRRPGLVWTTMMF